MPLLRCFLGEEASYVESPRLETPPLCNDESSFPEEEPLSINLWLSRVEIDDSNCRKIFKTCSVTSSSEEAICCRNSAGAHHGNIAGGV